MVKVADVIEALELVAPLRYKEEYDNPGVQVGLTGGEVTGVLVCLDVTEEVVAEAKRHGCNLILSHHPLIYRPIRAVGEYSYVQRCVREAILGGITIYSAHTNLDKARGGVNFKIASLLGLQSLEWLDPMAGEDAGMGLVGSLPAECPAEEFLDKVKSTFKVECLQHNDPVAPTVRRVAVCGGSGASYISRARDLGADALVTGEFKYHDWFDAEGLLLLGLGHYQSEQFTKDVLRDIVLKAFPEVKVVETELNTNPVRYR